MLVKLMYEVDDDEDGILNCLYHLFNLATKLCSVQEQEMILSNLDNIASNMATDEEYLSRLKNLQILLIIKLEIFGSSS